jgi:hypothetical protein
VKYRNFHDGLKFCISKKEIVASAGGKSGRIMVQGQPRLALELEILSEKHKRKGTRVCLK